MTLINISQAKTLNDIANSLDKLTRIEIDQQLCKVKYDIRSNVIEVKLANSGYGSRTMMGFFMVAMETVNPVFKVEPGQGSDRKSVV